MEIFPPNYNVTPHSSNPVPVSEENQHNKDSNQSSFQNGIVNGEVLNSTPDGITIQLPDKSILFAKLLQIHPSEIKTGLSYPFQLQKDDEGNFTAIVRLPTSQIQQPALLEVLQSAGLKNTNENITLVEKLMDNQLPVNSATLQNASRGIKLGAPLDTVLFLLENNLEITSQHIAQVNQYIHQENRIHNSINQFIDNLFQNTTLPQIRPIIESLLSVMDFDIPLQPTPVTLELSFSNALLESTLSDRDKTIMTEQFVQFMEKSENPQFLSQIKPFIKSFFESIGFTDDGTLLKSIEHTHKDIIQHHISTNNAKEIIQKAMTFPVKNSSIKELEKFFQDINKILAQTKLILKQADSFETKEILKNIKKIEDNLQFTSQLKDSTYIQIPIPFGEHNTTAELFVFKDKKNKQIKTGASSALIALDTGYLGHFETYIQKKNQNIHCQFRLSSDDVQKIVQNNISRLEHYLQSKNLHLKGYCFKKVEEAFTLLSQEPVAHATNNQNTKRFSFDIRM